MELLASICCLRFACRRKDEPMKPFRSSLFALMLGAAWPLHHIQPVQAQIAVDIAVGDGPPRFLGLNRPVRPKTWRNTKPCKISGIEKTRPGIVTHGIVVDICRIGRISGVCGMHNEGGTIRRGRRRGVTMAIGLLIGVV